MRHDNRYRRWTLDQVLKSGYSTDVILLYMQHPDGDVLLWNGLGVLDFDGREWKGLGRLGNVSIGEEDIETKVSEVTFTLSGVDSEMVSYLNQTVKGCKAWVWKAFMGTDYKVRFRELLVECELDQPNFSTEPNGQSTMVVVANGGFYFLEVQSRSLWDPEEQKNYLVSLGIDPNTDTGFDMMSQLKNLTLAWEHPG